MVIRGEEKMTVIGIDLGTTNSLGCVYRNGKAELIPNAYGSYLTPSVVSMTEDGKLIVGQPAKDRLITHPERTVSSFKKDMGTGRSWKPGEKSFLPEELSSLVIRSIVEDAQNYLGEEIEEAVISVPAYFHDEQRVAVKRAGALAGIHVERIVNEPSAAALASYLYFTGEGTMSFSDVIYALKSRKSNLLIKIESTLKTDPSGVDFFSDCRNAFDMIELKDDEIVSLIQAIGQVGEYEEIVVDLSGDLTERQLKLMQDYADSVIYICDGTMTGIRKFEKFCETIRVIEERKEVQIMNKIQLLYNRYSSKNSMQMEKLPVSLLGGIHRFENVSGRPLIDQIAKMDILRQVR